MINNYSTIRVQFEVQYIRVGGILVGLSYCKQSHTRKVCPKIKPLISPRYSSVKRSIIQGIEICQVLNPATDSEGEKGENIGNEYLPAYIMFRKACIVFHYMFLL